MAKQNVLMPQMGESIQEGTITQWHKKVGDTVQQDELLLEISTDKVDTEIPSPFAGTLVEILSQEGDVVKVNAPIAVIDPDAKGGSAEKTDAPKEEPKQEGSANDAPKAEAQKPEAKVESKEPTQPQEKQEPAEGKAETEAKPETEGSNRVVASPLARKIAKEHSVDLQSVRGTGDGNKIVKEDVLSAIQNGDKTQTSAAETGSAKTDSPLVTAAKKADDPALETLADGTRVQRVRMSTMRKKIAEHMVMSKQTSPHVTSIIEIDVQKIVDLRAKHKGKFESQYGFKLSFMPFFMEAALKAVKAVPIINSSIDGDTIIYKKDVNLGMAVALENGLIVPVIKNAHEKNFVGLGHELNSLAEKARTKKLLPQDVRGGTFSITSYGGFGTVIGQPIINQPQVAIFGIGAMQKKPVVINDAIAIRTMVYCVLSFDHRVIDGSDSGKFLSTVKNTLENWDTPL